MTDQQNLTTLHSCIEAIRFISEYQINPNQPQIPNRLFKCFEILVNSVTAYLGAKTSKLLTDTLGNIVDSEILHNENFTYLESLCFSRAKVSSIDIPAFYLTPLFLNVRPFRLKKGLIDECKLNKAFIDCLLKFCLASFPSILFMNMIAEMEGKKTVRQLIYIDTDPEVVNFVSQLFKEYNHISILPVDLSGYDFSTDNTGKKPSVLTDITTKNIQNLLPHDSSNYFTTNIDADDLISPVHNLLLQKYFNCASVASNKIISSSLYLCFPIGSQFLVPSRQLYSYIGCSNCFMTALTIGNGELPHVWITGHDSLLKDVPYTNIPTWHPVWTECIWGSNIANNVWPSSLPITKRQSSECMENLFGCLLSLVSLY